MDSSIFCCRSRFLRCCIVHRACHWSRFSVPDIIMDRKNENLIKYFTRVRVTIGWHLTSLYLNPGDRYAAIHLHETWNVNIWLRSRYPRLLPTDQTLKLRKPLLWSNIDRSWPSGLLCRPYPVIGCNLRTLPNDERLISVINVNIIVRVPSGTLQWAIFKLLHRVERMVDQLNRFCVVH